MKSLKFHILRMANKFRLPTFKNSKGELAHKKEDGSDWNPGQWFQALVGELGELATFRIKYECGQMTKEEFRKEAAKELADVQIYLDLLSQRILDDVELNDERDNAHWLMFLISKLGEYANAAKKYDRGDYSRGQFEIERHHNLLKAEGTLKFLQDSDVDRPRHQVENADPHGIDLGEATIAKFNEVSTRVGSPIFIHELGDHWHSESPDYP